MVDATVLIPTHRHALLLPYAIESALDQEGASLELFVVGDGVEDVTREILERYAHDTRVRFFDFPKGPRNGEAYRHEVLGHASGRIVSYLCDDDLLLRHHVATMLGVLEDADFAHPLTTRFVGDELLEFFPWNYGREEFREFGRVRIGSMGLTGVSHTLAAYRRLPQGWRTTPPGMPTDHYMWLQWLDAPGVRMTMGTRMTHLNFPDPFWRERPEEERARFLAAWFTRSREPSFAAELEAMLHDAIRTAAEDYHLWAAREKRLVQEMRATRSWRARDQLLSAIRKLPLGWRT